MNIERKLTETSLTHTDRGSTRTVVYDADAVAAAVSADGGDHVVVVAHSPPEAPLMIILLHRSKTLEETLTLVQTIK